MPAPTPSAWNAFIQRGHQVDPWLWCWDLSLAISTGQHTRVAIVNNPAPVVVDTITFNPFPIAQSPIEMNGEGDMPSLEIQIDNTSRLVSPYVEQGGGFLNRDCKLRLVNAGDLTAFYELDFRVVACTITQKVASIRLEVDNWFLRQVPLDVFHVARCRHVFGSLRCGYIINADAGFTDCGKHIQDCILRGENMTQRNLGARQPESFGGFLGVPFQ